MRFFKKSPFLLAVLLISSALIIQGCEEQNNRPTGPDFSNVPEPYDISSADSTFTKEGGVEIYIIEEGVCPSGEEEFCTTQPRDQISIKYTGRIFDGGTGEGDIFESTFSNDNDRPAVITNLTPNSTQQQAAQIEGFRRGLLGMKEGEKRVIVVPPSLGYSDSRPGVNGMDLREETLRYDVELVNIQ